MQLIFFVPLGLGSNAADTSFAHHLPYLPFFLKWSQGFAL